MYMYWNISIQLVFPSRTFSGDLFISLFRNNQEERRGLLSQLSLPLEACFPLSHLLPLVTMRNGDCQTSHSYQHVVIFLQYLWLWWILLAFYWVNINLFVQDSPSRKKTLWSKYWLSLFRKFSQLLTIISVWEGLSSTLCWASNFFLKCLPWSFSSNL